MAKSVGELSGRNCSEPAPYSCLVMFQSIIPRTESEVSSRWQELTAELAETDPEDALELLIEWGKLLPPLSPTRAALPLTDDCRVKECQTAVHLWVGVTRDDTVGDPLAGDRDERQPSAPLRVELEATVPEKSPTVRGLVALIVLGMNGMTVGEALAMPIDLLPVLKLDKVLGMQRRQGVRGVMQRIHSEIHRQVAGAPASP